MGGPHHRDGRGNGLRHLLCSSWVWGIRRYNTRRRPPYGTQIYESWRHSSENVAHSYAQEAIQDEKLSKLLETKYKGYDVNGHRGISEGRYEGPCPSPEMKLAHIEGVNPNLKDLSMPFSEFWSSTIARTPPRFGRVRSLLSAMVILMKFPPLMS